jgi:hypothetical protein
MLFDRFARLDYLTLVCNIVKLACYFEWYGEQWEYYVIETNGHNINDSSSRVSSAPLISVAITDAEPLRQQKNKIHGGLTFTFIDFEWWFQFRTKFRRGILFTLDHSYSADANRRTVIDGQHNWGYALQS